MASIRDSEIAPCSKYWAKISITFDGSVFLLQIHFFPKVDREQEASIGMVSKESGFFWGIHKKWSIRSDSFPKLCSKQSESIRYIVAEMMEVFGKETVFRCSEE